MSLWLGLTLASLFFYPLVAAADAQIILLHWHPEHTAELLSAFALCASIGALILEAGRRSVSRLTPAGLLLFVSIPVASFAFAMLRLAPGGSSFAPWASSLVVRAIVAACGLAIVGFTVLRPDLARRALRAALLVLSPIVIVVLLGMARLTDAGNPNGRVTREPVAKHRSTRSHVLVLLFDELSYSHLYESNGEIRPAYPALRGLGRTAVHYHAASAPGGETLVSLPGFFSGRRYHDTDARGDVLEEVAEDGRRQPLDLNTPENLFRRARAVGFRTELFGWYLPYCRMMPSLLDRCEAYSLYNASSVRPAFSPLDSVRTTLILWPHQFPAGLLKNPAFADHQRLLTSDLETQAGAPFEADRSVFRFIHFSVPHVPFVFDRNGYNPPFDPVTERIEPYERQVEYVDRIVGQILEALDRRGDTPLTTVVVISDHEFRAVTPREQWPHVPIIVRAPPATSRTDVRSPVRAEDVLRALIAPR